MTIVLLVCGLISGGAYCILLTYVWQDTNPRGVFESPSDWPLAVQGLHQRLQATAEEPVLVDGFLMYGYPGPHSGSEWAFRIHDAPAQAMPLLVQELGLVPIDADHPMADWGRVVVEKASSEWWPSPNSHEADFYASQHLLDGGEGDLYVVAYEKATDTVFISYHFNF